MPKFEIPKGVNKSLETSTKYFYSKNDVQLEFTLTEKQRPDFIELLKEATQDLTTN